MHRVFDFLKGFIQYNVIDLHKFIAIAQFHRSKSNCTGSQIIYYRESNRKGAASKGNRRAYRQLRGFQLILDKNLNNSIRVH